MMTDYVIGLYATIGDRDLVKEYIHHLIGGRYTKTALVSNGNAVYDIGLNTSKGDMTVTLVLTWAYDGPLLDNMVKKVVIKPNGCPIGEYIHAISHNTCVLITGRDVNCSGGTGQLLVELSNSPYTGLVLLRHVMREIIDDDTFFLKAVVREVTVADVIKMLLENRDKISYSKEELSAIVDKLYL